MSKIFSAEELHSIVGGKLFKNDWLVSGISIDSRTIKKNELFIALKAKRDGNDFIVSAIENGAKAAIISKIPKDLPKNFPFILVNNSVEALYSIAKYSREKYEGRVIAITGSVGKTSTKDILTKMLSAFGVIHSSQKSFNNHLGVPLTLANIPKNADYVICEIGMNSKGEIEPLSKLVAPDVAVITNISAAHLASFKNLREIAYEKASICFGLKKNGLLIYSVDNKFYELVNNFVKERKLKSVTFGSNENAEISIKNIFHLKNKSYGSLLIKNEVFTDFSIGALGSHQLKNCLAAFQADVDVVITMTPARRSPWFNMVLKDKSGTVSLVSKKNSVYRRQDSPACFDMTTVAYVARPEFILSAQKMWDGKVVGVEVPIERSLDIDTPFDFALAKFVMEQLKPNMLLPP